MTIQLTVNGTPTDVADGATVEVLVAARSSGHDRVAVALNGGVVARSRWAATELAPGDRLEVLAPTAGG